MDGSCTDAFHATIVFEFDGAGAAALRIYHHLPQGIAPGSHPPPVNRHVPARVPSDLYAQDLVQLHVSGYRLLAFDGERVTFRWKDYAHGGKQRTMTLLGTEFLHRFFLHVLPKGFVRIRYFGFPANRFRAHCLTLCQQLLASDRPTPSASSETTSNWHCPNCGAAMLVVHRLTAVELSRCGYFDTS